MAHLPSALTKEIDLKCPQQYIIGPAYVNNHLGWTQLKINDFLHLTAHPNLSITQLSTDERLVTLLGYLIDPERPTSMNQDILERLLADNRSPDDLIRATYGLGGVWVLIYEWQEKTILFHDCAGLRSVYYSIEDLAEKLWLASQPRLIAELDGICEDEKTADFVKLQKTTDRDIWWPGDRTRFSGIKALLPNHYLDLRNRRIHRYWPDRNLVSLNHVDAIASVSDTLKGSMEAAAHRFDLCLALSCGMDSRVMLAAGKEVCDKFCIYNGKRPEMPESDPDIAIPRRLTQKLNLKYHYLPQKSEIDMRFREAFLQNAPSLHKPILPGLQSELMHFKRRRVGVTGNVLEVARYYYNIFDPAMHPASGDTLARLAKMEDSTFAVDAFDQWLDGTGDTLNINLYDLFYWEQRLGRWMSSNCLVFYMSWKEIFFPFNCRKLLIDLLSVPGTERMPPDYRFYRELIHSLWPELLSEPINPPIKKSFFRKVKKKIKSVLTLGRRQVVNLLPLAFY